MPEASKKTCPICKSRFSTVEAGRDPYDVFCSERCKMADLGHWFTDSYRIGGKSDSTEDLDERLIPGEMDPSDPFIE